MAVENIRSTIIDVEGGTRENLIFLDQSVNAQYRFGMPRAALSRTRTIPVPSGRSSNGSGRFYNRKR
jgi:hypothetical protein